MRGRTFTPPGLHSGRTRARLHSGCGEARVSQSALSHTIRGFEERLDLRLLTPPRVAFRRPGERLLRTVGHRFEKIEAEVRTLSKRRKNQPARSDHGR
jgi:DNA-binding transcriptional LysR family regulator